MSLFQGFNKRYQDELKEEIASLDATILAGNIPDFTEYKRLTGKRAAYAQTLYRHQELLTLMEQAND